ncbi:MAG TPA: cold shock and DUF1294 domain-containing protein [Pyrinomonadaceae bacterium]|nr:cold shock and DUF1294 domain-containing protein [Pyrinomonadaceae bacterium]
MRLKGKLKSWNDDRGFGFIDPIQGGQEIFVHIKAFGPRSNRPQINELLWFEVEFGPQGKKRAKNVELVRKTVHDKLHRKPSTQKGSVTLLAIPGFLLLYVVVSNLWQSPDVLVIIYAGVSVLTFIAYAIDKSAARRGARRTPEATLHLLAFACGWPGALLAQQFLRHKSIKPEFRVVFWSTVILNIAGFVLFCSPFGQQLWATMR